jgi:hypothetical protein
MTNFASESNTCPFALFFLTKDGVLETIFMPFVHLNKS